MAAASSSAAPAVGPAEAVDAVQPAGAAPAHLPVVAWDPHLTGGPAPHCGHVQLTCGNAEEQDRLKDLRTDEEVLLAPGAFFY